MVNPRLLLSTCAGLALSTMVVACDRSCDTFYFQSCQTTGTGSVIAPARFSDPRCAISVDAYRFPLLDFTQPCTGATGSWDVRVTLPKLRRTASYALPSSEVMVNALFSYGATDIYGTAGGAGAAPTLWVTGGTISETITGSHSGTVSVDIQFENSIKETMSLVEQVTYTDCTPNSEVICDA